ncbi:MAG: HAMP domain-containing protein [Chloracidobacterium sp.]|nr:HAMP domain-containing protein [Chloracidobacterium sp.]
MKLFVKIFLWFLAAIALMIGVIIFVTRTFQTEPMFSRFKRSTQNQMTIYGDTATQIVRAEGEAGLRQFLERLRDMEPSREINLVAANGTLWFGEPGSIRDVADFGKLSIESNTTEADFSPEDRTIGYAPVTFPDGRRFAMVLQWERPPSSSLFWGSTTSYIRLLGILLTATILCYLLALYLTSPIRKLRAATMQLAGGDLQTRVAPKIGRRRDELADLARDFDEMAVRIESLITSQQRLNRDISHELRSPLARLNVALEIAKQKSNAESKPMLERIEAESTRLNDMIGRLLTLAQLESGAVEVERVRVDLAELVRDVAADADFEAKANGRHVEITRITACSVMGSENLLRSAIENVLRNAVKYTGEGTVVEVDLAVSNGRATVSVADHGGGVPDDELPNLFRPFYRVGEARERKTGGIGLGLAIAERAVKAHKGKITARNANGGLQIDIELEKA